MTLFFRADDAGWGHERFERLAALFAGRGQRLNAAAIPLACLQSRPPLPPRALEAVEFHSHGWAHLDHESAGKKCEFGPARAPETVARELEQSRAACAELFGERYFPAFVPPWNRIDERFVSLLPAAGFRALSRDGAARAGMPGLVELNVRVDLHTSRAPAPASPEAVLEAVSAFPGPAGIMLHHARMGDADFAFLDALLRLLPRRGARSAFFSELAR